MLANDVHDGRHGTSRVMQIRKSVRKSRPEMKKCGCRAACHACIAVGSSCRNSLEEAQNRTHAADLVDRGNEVDLRSTWIGKTGIDAGGKQAAYQRLGAGHALLFWGALALPFGAQTHGTHPSSIAAHA